jgi:hypothetical protein
MEVLVNGQQVVSENFSAEHNNDLFYFDGGNARDASAPVVFAGYGIAADSLGYNDFKSLQDNNISINDKWVMILDDEPLADEKTSLLPTYNHQRSPWAGGFFHKRLALWNAGRPKGILIVTDLVPGHKAAFAKEALMLHKMHTYRAIISIRYYSCFADVLHLFKDGKHALEKYISDY